MVALLAEPKKIFKPNSNTNIVKIFLFTIISIVVIPLLTAITIPILIYRQIVILWVQHVYKYRKDILKIVDPPCQLLAPDMFKPNPRINVINCWIVEGTMSLDTMRELFLTNVIEKQRQHSQIPELELEFPEMSCQPVNIGSYYYWQKISNFDIQSYIKIFTRDEKDFFVEGAPIIPSADAKIPYQGFYEETTEDDLKKITAHLLSSPWKKGQSPWELWIVPNYVDKANQKIKKSVIIFKIHHFMADGHSVLSILKSLSAGNFKASAIPKNNLKPKKTLQVNTIPFLQKVLIPLILPYQMALLLSELSYWENHSWKLSPEHREKAGEKYWQNWSSGIPVESIKRIKNTLGVSFTAVINCIVGGTIQNLMRIAEQEVPSSLKAHCQIPLPNHPHGLTNYFGFLYVRIPVGETDNLKRLEEAAAELESLRNSTLPFTSYMLYYLLGHYPSIFTKLLLIKEAGSSMGLSVFAGLDGCTCWGGHNGLDGCYSVGSGVGDIGVTISVLTNLEKVRLAIAIDSHVYSCVDKLQELDAIVNKEVDSLLAAIRAE